MADTQAPPAKRARLDEDTPMIEGLPTPTPMQTTAPAATADASSVVSQVDAEIAVGITEYLNPSIPGFEGVLKKRYTDFLVNEIDEDGNVVHLTTLSVPQKQNQPETEKKDKPSVASPPKDKNRDAKEQTAEKTEADQSSPFTLSAEDAAELTALSSESTTAECVALYNSLANNDTSTNPSPKSVITPAIESKETRSTLHNLIRRLFSGKLETSTLNAGNDGEAPKIQIAPASSNGARSGRRGGKRNRTNADTWAELGGEYCHFSLYKENRDTMEVCNLLPRLLKIRNQINKIFTFAGTKDRRACTVQRVAAFKIKAERLEALNKGGMGGLRDGVRLGDFVYKPKGLDLGSLSGNEFAITLRSCRPLSKDQLLQEIVATAVAAVKKTGFANYFGLQRFGSFAIPTHEIGIPILNSNWRRAVEQLFVYDPAYLTMEENGPENINNDDKLRAEACHIFLTTYDFAAAAQKIPRRFVAESTILKAFNERAQNSDGKGGGLDYHGAIQAIPRALRIMYVHAYQSYVWNHVLSARLRMSRDKVLPGDLVIIDEQPKEEVKPTEEVDQDGEVVISAVVAAKEKVFARARPLSAEEAASGAFAMTDIVLPTPGWDVVYPQNELMDIYKDVMAKDGLNPLDMRRNIRDWSLPGGYRNIVASFLGGEEGISWHAQEVLPDEQVVETDLEKVLGDKKRKRENEPVALGEKEPAVVLRMKLGTSTYATMALRELMKAGVKAYRPEYGRH